MLRYFASVLYNSRSTRLRSAISRDSAAVGPDISCSGRPCSLARPLALYLNPKRRENHSFIAILLRRYVIIRQALGQRRQTCLSGSRRWIDINVSRAVVWQRHCPVFWRLVEVEILDP